MRIATFLLYAFLVSTWAAETSSFNRNICSEKGCLLVSAKDYNADAFMVVQQESESSHNSDMLIEHFGHKVESDDEMLCLCIAQKSLTSTAAIVRVSTGHDRISMRIAQEVLSISLLYVAEYDIYINYLPDEAANPSSCNTTLQSSSSQCNFRSAVALCAELFAVEATGSCVVHFPVSSNIITIDARLGDITISNTNGQLVLLGNGATVQMTKLPKKFSRFLSVYCDAAVDCALSLYIENLTISGFGESGVSDGGSLYTSTLDAVILQDVTFRDNTGYHGGALFFSQILDIQLLRCTFSFNTATYGGAVHFAPSNELILVDGCVIANSTSKDNGGGIHMSYDNDYAVIINTNFTGNNAVNHYGGGICFDGEIKNLFMSNCFFAMNRAEDGGGISILSGQYVTIDRCTFMSNKVTGSGGGIFFRSTSQYGLVTNCLLYRNTAMSEGGGIEYHQSNDDMSIFNTTFISNGAVGSGGGLDLHSDNDHFVMKNCLFEENFAFGPGGGARFITDNTEVNIASCIFRRNIGVLGAGLSFGSNNNNFILNEVVMESNVARDCGGGLGVQDGNDASVVANCTFAENVAGIYGGGAFLISSNMKLLFKGNVFMNNSCSLGGASLAA
jgi:hypothetical protein